MNTRTLLLCAVLLTAARASAQAPTPQDLATAPPTALTAKLLMAQRPANMTEEQWRRTALNPMNATLFPIRLTQSMLDTLDAKQLDKRWHYVLAEPTR